jgi:hypothetical protein
MDLLTFVGLASRRRENYEERARDLVSLYSSLEGLEEEMEERAEKLALRLKESRVTLSEFRRAAAEDTLVSSLAALMLGRENDENLPQSAFMEAMGQMKYLWNFFDDIKLSLDSGRLSDSDSFEEEENDDWYYLIVPGEDTPFPIEPQERDFEAPIVSPPTSLVVPVTSRAAAMKAAVNAVKTSEEDLERAVKSFQVSATATTDSQAAQAQKSVKPAQRQRGPATWKGLVSRLKRFLVTPLYRWFNQGEYEGKATKGYREMRRITRRDRRVCYDCKYYESLGWVPIGSLPMPGVQCRCHDRCRCRMEYR